MEKVKTKGYITQLEKQFIYESEVFDTSEKLDTEVILQDFEVRIPLMYISGAEIDNFNRELTELFERYRI